jgi:hypothetical protein
MAELGRMCAAAGSEERPAPIYECTHGLGHGILGAVGFDARRALRYCDALTEARLATSCREGVFMEGINSVLRPSRSHDGHRAHEHGRSSDSRLTLDRSNPYAPCDRFADPYATSCWLFQGFVILRYRSFDPAGAFRICDAAPPVRLERCYESVGFQLTGVFQRDDAWIIQQCAKGRPRLASQCAAGAAAALAGVDWSGGRAAAFCTASPIEWKEPCYRALGSMLGVLASPARRAEVCGSVERTFAGACREAAGA